MKNKPETYIEEVQMDAYANGKVAEMATVVDRVSDSDVMLQKMESHLERLLMTVRAKRKKFQPRKIVRVYEVNK